MKRPYLSRDAGLDAQRKKAAEAEVSEWREQEHLQFPNLDPEHVRSLKDSLDWPPAGSKREASGSPSQPDGQVSNPQRFKK